MMIPQSALDIKKNSLPFLDKKGEFPVLTPTNGPEMLDIGDLHKSTGVCTLDIGLMNTGICKSAITYVNGDEGILRYRGYSIDDLVDNCDYFDVAWVFFNSGFLTHTKKTQIP